MRLYHFLNAKYGLEGIRNRRIKISRIMELNDPFEFLGADISDREFRKALKKTKSDMSKTKGILCFSKTWKNPLLWSHYADKHKGVCLGFDVSNEIIEKVDYLSERFPVPQVLDDAFMKKILFSKFEHWSYEQEYRAFIELEEEIDGLFYSDFSDEIKLIRVIVGDQSKVSRAEISDALGSIGDEVEAFKARAGFTKFEVVRQQNDKLWA
jgi:hypothetical protein